MLKSLVSILSLGLFVTACGSAVDQEVVADEIVETAKAEQPLGFARPSRSLRVAVVGAGASGLTAADTLKQLGYKKVTVFEKNNRVGGKVYSFQSGSRIVELGAVFASPDYRHVLGLAEKYDIPYVTYSGVQNVVDENGKVQTPEEFLQSRYSTAEILGATAAYAGVLALFSPVTQNGFATIPPQSDLYMPFTDFAKKYGITPIAELLRGIMVGFGYGYYETAPAIYYMKLMPWLAKLSPTKGLDTPTYYTFPTGYQSIWQAVADGLDVRLNSEVTSIVRPSPSGAAVQVTINGEQKYDFDEVIISVPLNRVSKFMSLHSKEQQLFSQMESLRYDVSLFTASGLPTEQALFFHGNSNPARINHAVAWTNANAALPYQTWQILEQSATPEQITSTLASDVTAMGGQFGTVLLRQDWEDYFPHVKTAALKDNFYYKLELMQGDRHTYYVGGGLSFETVEHAARYADQLVRLHFFPAFLP